MRKLVVLSFITLDGIMQAPGGPDEDISEGFSFGGWSVPYFDERLGDVMTRQLEWPFAMVLGRKTYDIMAAYWPNHDDEGAEFNRATKYIASRSKIQLNWENSEQLQGDIAEAIKKIKSQDGPDLHVHGSGDLIQTLLKHDLVDELWLKIYPITLGSGKLLFSEGTIQNRFELLEIERTQKGVIVASYARAGAVETGIF